MSTGLPNEPNGEQQLGINPGSPNKGRQMGINPCPYTNMGNKWAITHVHAQKGQQLGINPGPPKDEQQMGINPCSYTKETRTTNGH
jgi:hypothetical protein